MEYSPPPLFKQGASARAKVVFFAVISLALLVMDARLHTLSVIRQAVGTALYPLQMIALFPRDAAYAVAGYFMSVDELTDENTRLKQQQILNAQTLQRAQQLLAENAHLRNLLGASEQLPVKSLMSEILYDARDSFTRKIVLDRGLQHGVLVGQPVIDDLGVVGQVTRVFPLTAEVTLLTDKNQAIPVQVVRNGLRSVAYGRGQTGMLDLRFMPTNADIQKGDLLVTSGIDGIYPPGLSVARVQQVDTKSSDTFARIQCVPTAGINHNRHLLILLVDTSLPSTPVTDATTEQPEEKSNTGKSGVPGTESTKQKGPAGAAPAASPTVPAKPATSAPVRSAPNVAPATPATRAPAQPVPNAAPAQPVPSAPRNPQPATPTGTTQP